VFPGVICVWTCGGISLDFTGDLRELSAPVDKPVDGFAALLTTADHYRSGIEVVADHQRAPDWPEMTRRGASLYRRRQVAGASTALRRPPASGRVPAVRLAVALVLGSALLVGCAERAPRAAPGEARRVISLTPSSTELVAAAGGLDRLVAVDRYSSHPPEVDALPEVGDFLSPRIEAILALKPDLVVLDEVQRKTAEKLAAAGVATLVLDVHRIEDVRAGLLAVGEALGTRGEAERAIARMDRELAELRDRAAARGRTTRVLVAVDREHGGLRGLVAAGAGSFLDELVALAGGDNVVAAGGRYVKLAADRVVAASPEVILDATHGAAVADWSEIARVPAVAAGRVHPLSDGSFQAPTPRAAAAARHLEALLHPR
jgi:iron complex transport system substrate-binding protein